jgi:hypothetical protein
MTGQSLLRTFGKRQNFGKGRVTRIVLEAQCRGQRARPPGGKLALVLAPNPLLPRVRGLRLVPWDAAPASFVARRSGMIPT